MPTQSKSTHTPGPWIVKHSGFGDCSVIAKCGYKNKDGSDFEPTIIGRIDWPTGQLIAAAPELLAAVASFIDEMEITDDGQRRLDIVLERAKAAIRKAEGGSK